MAVGLATGHWGSGSPRTALGGDRTDCPFLQVFNLGSHLPLGSLLLWTGGYGPMMGWWVLGWAWEDLRKGIIWTFPTCRFLYVLLCECSDELFVTERNRKCESYVEIWCRSEVTFIKVNRSFTTNFSESKFVPVCCMTEMKADVIYILQWKEKNLAYAIILYTYNYFGTPKKKKKSNQSIIVKLISFQFWGIIYCKNWITIKEQFI